MEDFQANSRQEFDGQRLAYEFEADPSGRKMHLPRLNTLEYRVPSEAAINKRIESGEYVALEGQGAVNRASSLLDKLRNWPYLGDPGFFMQSRAMKEYTNRADAATVDINNREWQIAQEKWNCLTPALRAVIKQENPQVINLTNPPKAKPNSDRFIKELSSALALLEAEKDARIRKVWQDLPVKFKVEIFREQDIHKRFRPHPYGDIIELL